MCFIDLASAEKKRLEEKQRIARKNRTKSTEEWKTRLVTVKHKQSNVVAQLMTSDAKCVTVVLCYRLRLGWYYTHRNAALGPRFGSQLCFLAVVYSSVKCCPTPPSWGQNATLQLCVSNWKHLTYSILFQWLNMALSINHVLLFVCFDHYFLCNAQVSS